MTEGPDWDAIAAKLGMSPDWREEGYDSPEYIASDFSVYQVVDDNDRLTGMLKCVWPGCSFRRRSVYVMFRHVHNPKLHRETRRDYV